jgi:hypothetical protein
MKITNYGWSTRDQALKPYWSRNLRWSCPELGLTAVDR